LGLDSSKAIISAVNYVYEMSGSQSKLSRTQRLDHVEKHIDAATFATQINRSPYKKNTVHAAFIRAYYHYNSNDDRDRLQKAITILNSGVYKSEKDTGMTRLRQWIDKYGSGRGGDDRKELYKKTELAIKHFMDEEPVLKLGTYKDELFPLPEEKTK
jgi:hypothetical protein